MPETAVAGNADDEGLLWKRFGRSRLREFVVDGGNGSFGRTFNRVEDSLSESVVAALQVADVRSHQRRIGMRGEFAVGHVVAKYVEIAVVVVLIALVVEGRERRGCIGLERGGAAVEHGSCFRRRARLLRDGEGAA